MDIDAYIAPIILICVAIFAFAISGCLVIVSVVFRLGHARMEDAGQSQRSICPSRNAITTAMPFQATGERPSAMVKGIRQSWPSSCPENKPGDMEHSAGNLEASEETEMAAWTWRGESESGSSRGTMMQPWHGLEGKDAEIPDEPRCFEPFACSRDLAQGKKRHGPTGGRTVVGPTMTAACTEPATVGLSPAMPDAWCVPAPPEDTFYLGSHQSRTTHEMEPEPGIVLLVKALDCFCEFMLEEQDNFEQSFPKNSRGIGNASRPSIAESPKQPMGHHAPLRLHKATRSFAPWLSRDSGWVVPLNTTEHRYGAGALGGMTYPAPSGCDIGFLATHYPPILDVDRPWLHRSPCSHSARAHCTLPEYTCDDCLVNCKRFADC